ncbi:MAG: type IV pilus biogenesis/stability protein PilW [Pseudomonadota bacterium]
MRSWILPAAAALSMLGTACTTTTTVDGSQAAATAAPAVDPDARKRADIRLQLAASYYQKAQFNVALEEAQRALQADPNYAEAYGLLGLIYMDLGDRREADANFARALKLDPASPELNNNYGWYLCQTGRERESIEHFVRAAQTKLYATPGKAMQNAGVCMMQVRDYKAAEQYLRRSLELDATSPFTKFHLARLYLATRQLDRAAFYYGLLEKQIDATAETLWLGLRIARASGDVRTERQFADDLRRLFPNSPEASALRRGAFDD